MAKESYINIMKKIIIVLFILCMIIGLCSCDPYADERAGYKAEIEKLKNEISELSSQLADEEADNEELSQKLTKAESTVAGLNLEIERMRERGELDEATIAELEGDLEEALTKVEGLKHCVAGEHEYVNLTEDHIHDYCYYRECKWCKNVQSMTHSYIRQSDSTRTQHHLKCAECDYELTEDHIGRGEDTTEVIDRTKQTMMVYGRVYAKGSYYHLDITDIPHIVEEADGTCEGCNWAISHYEVSNTSTYELDAYGRPAKKCTVNGMNAIRLTHPDHDFIECDIKNVYIADCEIKLEENYTFDIAILYIETVDGWYNGSGTAVDPPTVVLGDAFLQ